MRREGLELLLAHAAQGCGIALACALAGPTGNLEIFEPVGVALHAQRAVTILRLDIAVPQARILEQMAVGIDGAAKLQMMNGLGIEYRTHACSSAIPEQRRKL